MSEINVITVGNATHRISSFSYPPQLPSIVEFKDFSRAIYTRLTESDKFDLRTSSRSEEFLAYGLVGAPGGEDIAPVIWSSHGQAEMYGRLCNAKNVLIHTVPYAIYFAANNYENVYVLNSSSTLISKEHLPSGSEDINNVTTLSWDAAYNNMPQLDMAIVLYSHICADDSLFDAIMNAMNPNGVVIIQNSSNGGALYEALGDKKPLEMAAQVSLSALLHKKIIDRGDFLTQHFQGWVSHTVCVKLSS
jgi:hypothetical protein